ncbi:hypothetical protein HPSD74_0956 [Glaesserella parasuis D74]|nr:hypothetical protein HPSD74_0956 [Glaesserella parasuis D74]
MPTSSLIPAVRTGYRQSSRLSELTHGKEISEAELYSPRFWAF